MPRRSTKRPLPKQSPLASLLILLLTCGCCFGFCRFSQSAIQNSGYPTRAPLTPAATRLPATRTPRLPTEEPPQLRVAVTSANVRSGPGTNYPRIDTVAKGEILPIVAANRDHSWYNVRFGITRRGWIAASVVETVNEELMADVHIAVTIPAPPTTAPAVNSQPPPANEQAPPPAPAAVCSCSGNVYNCSSFGSHAQAQACYNYCLPIAGDIHDLDRDNDGSACDSLR